MSQQKTSPDASDLLAAKKGWTLRRDGTAWRRVVPSPEPQQILEIEPITWLLDVGAELFLMATDVDGVYLHWGTREQRRLDRVTPGQLASYRFAAGAGRPESTASGRFRHPHHRRRSGRRSHSAYDMESSIRNSAPPGRGRVNTSAAVA